MVTSQHFAEKLIASTEVFVFPSEVFERPGHFRVGFELHSDKFRGATNLMSEFIASKKGWEYLSGDKNMIPLKVANSGFFCFNGTSSCPEPKTRTCTDYRKGQEHSPITD